MRPVDDLVPEQEVVDPHLDLEVLPEELQSDADDGFEGDQDDDGGGHVGVAQARSQVGEVDDQGHDDGEDPQVDGLLDHYHVQLLNLQAGLGLQLLLAGREQQQLLDAQVEDEGHD